MAQYFDDFTGHTVDAVPSNYTARWDGNLVGTVRADARGSDGRVLELVNTRGNGRNLFSWDDIDADPLRADVEVLTRFYQEATETDADNRIGLRASGTGSSETGYTAGYVRFDNAIRHGRYVGASFSNMGMSNESYTNGEWYFQRVQLIDGNLKTRVWPDDGSPEPSTWNLEENNVSITQAGWVGFFCYNDAGWSLIDFVGVGTGGDPAPDAPVATVTTPVNLTATQVTDTTALLSWEDG